MEKQTERIRIARADRRIMEGRDVRTRQKRVGDRDTIRGRE